MDISKQNLIVTGAASGIGLSVARCFAERRAQVLMCDIDGPRLDQEHLALSGEGYRVAAATFDVTDSVAVASALANYESRAGSPTTFVYCAGVLLNALVVDMSPEQWQRVLTVNLTGAFLSAQYVARAMIAAAVPGRMIFMASEAGKRGARHAAAYCASKFGLIGLLQSLALELAPYGITVNGVCPGDVETPMQAANVREMGALAGISEDEYSEQVSASTPLGRLARPEEIANLCLFLASDQARYITGETVNIDGGRLTN